jgi:hypothetical protein
MVKTKKIKRKNIKTKNIKTKNIKTKKNNKKRMTCSDYIKTKYYKMLLKLAWNSYRENIINKRNPIFYHKNEYSNFKKDFKKAQMFICKKELKIFDEEYKYNPLKNKNLLPGKREKQMFDKIYKNI